jgi:hypothetical protein
MEKDGEFIETIGKNIDSSLRFWLRRYDDDVMVMLNSNIKLAEEAGADISVKVKPRAFKKENKITYFPEGMDKVGKREEDGSMTFEITKDNGLSVFAVKEGLPYVIVYAGSCSLEGRFAPSDIESIRLH